MVFGIVIVNAARSGRVPETPSADPLYRLGWPDGGCWSDSAVPGAVPSQVAAGARRWSIGLQNGWAMLHAYVQHTFGGGGSFLLAAFMFDHLPGHGGWPDLCLCRILRPVRTALLSYAGVSPRRLLDGGV
ncbi:hypothetical protein ACNKHN_01825 [Shigella flexneri]